MQVGFTVNLGPADRLRGNLAALLAAVANLEATAVLLNDAPSIVTMLDSDHCLANDVTVLATETPASAGAQPTIDLGYQLTSSGTDPPLGFAAL